jgi:hypothetical protein
LTFDQVVHGTLETAAQVKQGISEHKVTELKRGKFFRRLTDD